MADTVDPDPPPPPPMQEVVQVDTVQEPKPEIPPDAPPPRQGCMAKRSCFEKVLIVILIIVILMCLAFAAAFVVYYLFASPPEGTCLTDECVNAATRLTDHMDQDVDPCNNFYQYACGKWIKNNELDPHEVKKDYKSNIKDDNDIKLKGILDEAPKKNDSAYKVKPRAFYKTYLDMNKLKERGAKPFTGLLKKTGLKYPSLDATWNETDFNLVDTLIKLGKLGYQPLVGVVVDVHEEDHRIFVGPAQFRLGNLEAYKDEKTLEATTDYLVKVLIFLGVSEAEAKEDIEDVKNFEIKLTKLVTKDSFAKKMSIPDFYHDYPWLEDEDGPELINALGTKDDGKGKDYVKPRRTKIMNGDENYLMGVGTLLENTPKRVLTNYLMSHLLELTRFLDEDYFQLNVQRQKAIDGKEPNPHRWVYCVEETAIVFKEAVSRMFVDKYFSREAMTYMKGLINDLKKAFKELVGDSTWMTSSAKKNAEYKLDQMVTMVGYAKNIMDKNLIEDLYDDGENVKEFFETVVKRRQVNAHRQLALLHEDWSRETWKTRATNIESYYSVQDNAIIFPAAILQKIVFDLGYPSSMNYGGIGTVIGREMTHGFDKEGSLLDGYGMEKKWWTDKDLKNFEAQTMCFEDQYGCYKWDGISLDGVRTLDENIADNGGLKMAFKAYRNRIRSQGAEEKRLPGLTKLTQNQIFFLSFAQVYCAKYSEGIKQNLVDEGTHTVNEYRVLGAIQNSADFAKAFECPSGKRMNPLRKCIVW